MTVRGSHWARLGFLLTLLKETWWVLYSAIQPNLGTKIHCRRVECRGVPTAESSDAQGCRRRADLAGSPVRFVLDFLGWRNKKVCSVSRRNQSRTEDVKGIGQSERMRQLERVSGPIDSTTYRLLPALPAVYASHASTFCRKMRTACVMILLCTGHDAASGEL